MKTILGVIITYNPNLDLLKKNINSFIASVNEVLIIDNGSESFSDLFQLENNNIKILSNASNLGIADGLNRALLYAEENHFDYILTMDQDSFFESINSKSNQDFQGIFNLESKG